MRKKQPLLAVLVSRAWNAQKASSGFDDEASAEIHRGLDLLIVEILRNYAATVVRLVKPALGWFDPHSTVQVEVLGRTLKIPVNNLFRADPDLAETVRRLIPAAKTYEEICAVLSAQLVQGNSNDCRWDQTPITNRGWIAKTLCQRGFGYDGGDYGVVVRGDGLIGVINSDRNVVSLVERGNPLSKAALAKCTYVHQFAQGQSVFALGTFVPETLQEFVSGSSTFLLEMAGTFFRR